MDSEYSCGARAGLERPVGAFRILRELTNIFLTDRAAMSRPARQYEFPTGYSTYFGPERFTVGEQYFRHSADLIVRSSDSK
jgi:Actin